MSPPPPPVVFNEGPAVAGAGSVSTTLCTIPVGINNRHERFLGFLGSSHNSHRNNLVLTDTMPPTTNVKTANFCLLNVRSLANKSFICQEFITANEIDFFIIAESWLNLDDCAPLIESSLTVMLRTMSVSLTTRAQTS